MEPEFQVWTIDAHNQLVDLIVVGAVSESEAKELARDIVGDIPILVVRTED